MNRVTARGLVAIGAVMAAMLVWVVAVPIFGADITVPDSPGSTVRTELQLPLVVMTATVAVLAGWALLALLERFTSRALTVWTVTALAVLVLTLPYLPGFTVTERFVLGSMHLALAAVLIWGLRAATTAPRRRASRQDLATTTDDVAANR